MQQFKLMPDSVVETPRLRLVRFMPKDAPRLYEAVRFSSEALSPFLPWCHANYNLLDAERWIAFTDETWNNRTQFAYFIEEKSSGRLVGGCGLDSPDNANSANLGYWIRSDCTHQGYASEAAAVLAACALEHLALSQLKITMSIHNLASQQVAVKIGARFDHIAPKALTLHGISHDAFVYFMQAKRINRFV
ncbi:MAG: GNAT family N-acetyltransferase [Pseudomonadales bacterium]